MPVPARKIIGWSLIALLLTFIVLNFHYVKVRFLIFTVELPTAFLIFGSAALGGGAVYALRYWKDFRKPPTS